MSAKVHSAEVAVSGSTSVERTCSFCHKSWAETIKIDAAGTEYTHYRRPREKDFRKAEENARKLLTLEEKRAKKQVDKKVLCPSCGHFSTGAMAKHFPEGFRPGLGRKLKRSLGYSLIYAAVLGPLGILLAGAVLSREWNSANIWARIAAGLWSLFMIGYSVTSLVHGFKIVFGFSRVKRFLRARSEDELLEIVVAQYKRKGRSLAGTRHWAGMLLKLRPSPPK